MDLLTQIKENGIVGAGGAGFPSHVKFGSEAEILVVNAAECEPLLQKDKEMLKALADQFLKGCDLLRKQIKAKKTIIGIKGKYKDVIALLETKLPSHTEVFPLRDYYPTGDEITLIYETTGRIVGAGQLPITQGVIVSNVETIYNVAQGGPVVTKFLSIGGDVENPVTVEVPIGTSFRSILELARPKSKNFSMLIGGPMMGKLSTNVDDVVTKTTGGIIVLPNEHRLIERYEKIGQNKMVWKIGKSGCDQCSICTELCPRYLLGHPVQPHKAMRSLLFTNDPSVAHLTDTHAQYCCNCNLCTLYACPEDLFPAQVTGYLSVNSKKKALKFDGELNRGAHPIAEYRRIPSSKIIEKLDLKKYENKGPMVPFPDTLKTFKIKLSQHIGAPAEPLVKQGDAVTVGQKIATVGTKLGSEIHASVTGKVTQVTPEYIELSKN